METRSYNTDLDTGLKLAGFDVENPKLDKWSKINLIQKVAAGGNAERCHDRFRLYHKKGVFTTRAGNLQNAYIIECTIDDRVVHTVLFRVDWMPADKRPAFLN